MSGMGQTRARSETNATAGAVPAQGDPATQSLPQPVRPRRGEIYLANLNPGLGSEQGGVRPVVVVQNEVGNRFSPTTIVAPITSRTDKGMGLPTHVLLPALTAQLPLDGQILLEQIRVVDCWRLKRCLGVLPGDVLKQVEQALQISLGLCPDAGEEAGRRAQV